MFLWFYVKKLRRYVRGVPSCWMETWFIRIMSELMPLMQPINNESYSGLWHRINQDVICALFPDQMTDLPIIAVKVTCFIVFLTNEPIFKKKQLNNSMNLQLSLNTPWWVIIFIWVLWCFVDISNLLNISFVILNCLSETFTCPLF